MSGGGIVRRLPRPPKRRSKLDGRIQIRLDDELADRISLAHGAVQARAAGVRVERSELLRTLILRGLDALETDLGDEGV